MISAVRIAAALVLGLVAVTPASASRGTELGPPPESGFQQPSSMDVDTVARIKIEGARAALAARHWDAAGLAVLEVTRLAGVSDRRKAEAYTVACDMGVRVRDWELAKTMCDSVLILKGAAKEDREWATETLQAIRKQAPGLFKPGPR
jgi:hypothetical protein